MILFGHRLFQVLQEPGLVLEEKAELAEKDGRQLVYRLTNLCSGLRSFVTFLEHGPANLSACKDCKPT